MKVLALNGSPHLRGNTYTLMQIVIQELRQAGITVEFVQLAKIKLDPCRACFKCAKNKNMLCGGIKDDNLNELMPRIIEADGILLGSPTWFSNVSGYVKNFIDRAGLVTRMNDNALSGKVGAAVVAVRRAGAVPTFDAINHFFLINGMYVPGASYWNIGIGKDPGDCAGDEEGVATMKSLGLSMAHLLKKLAD